jgi:hypothetical protein
MALPLLKRAEATVNNSHIRLFFGLSVSFFGPSKAGSAAMPLSLYQMKKLIVTCTAVAYAIAFIGCAADTESLPGDDTGGDEDEEDDVGETLPGGAGDDKE